MPGAMELIADPVRREILRNIWTSELTVNELVERVAISQPAMSFHLKVLRTGSLVRVRKDGTRRFYQADPESVGLLRNYLETYWADALSRLKDQAEIEARRERRNEKTDV